ncbi:MAG: AAA family ATPase [Bryobacteraceae bacterium]|nr:AAA family ATPase [Bryobacteraceae bacterium]
MDPITIRHEPPDSRILALAAEYREWLAAVLGCAPGEMAVAEFDLPIDRWVLGRLLQDVDLMDEAAAAAGEAGLVERIEPPPQHPPLFRLSPELPCGHPQSLRWSWKVRWGATPVAVWIRGLERPFVLAVIDIMEAGERRRRCNVAFLRRADLAPLTRRLAEFLASSRAKKDIFVVNGPDLSFTPRAGWDHLVLDERVRRLVRDDFERFLSSRAWFESKGIPFRRGYLLYGPPGNGKTSIVRAMASTPGIAPAMLVWGRQNTDDDDLTHLFRWAAEHAPALVIMEDLDRHFSHAPHAERQHRISLAHLLNCLDGVQSNEGVIVVATANHPKALDPAILSRPGRFDRVVELPNPDEALRLEYFRKQLDGTCSQEQLRRIARRSAGFSFAQLREAYITAACLAFDRNRDVAAADVEEAVELLAGAAGQSAAGARRRPVGFGEAGAAA